MKNRLISYMSAGLTLFLIAGGCGNSEIDPYRLNAPVYSVFPYDTPLDAVKWTDGFWHDRMEKLRNIYFPGVIDGSFISTRNGSTFRNFERAAGIEDGGWLGKSWGDGDCYFVLDVASRLYAYKPDTLLKSKLDYWIPLIEKIQDSSGVVDTRMTIEKQASPDFAGNQYNVAHMYKAALSNYRATGDTLFLSVASKFLNHYIRNGGVSHQVTHACGLHYCLTGDEEFLNTIKKYYSPDKQGSTFGPPFLKAREVFGHNTQTSHELNGGTWLAGLTGDTAFINVLKILADNLLSAKMYITGAVAPVHRQTEPIVIDGKEYKVNMIEAVGYAYDLPNETAYCESCGQNLYMEFFYRMFRLTGDSKYMDAVERMLYNTVTGCVDLENPHFFYANPQEQFENSMRFDTSSQAGGMRDHYTWKRTFLKRASCCPPKVMRGIAMSNEIAYSINDKGLWVNLYGNNTFAASLPPGGTVECKQELDYPWDGKVSLTIEKVKSAQPLSIFLRIPEWVNSPIEVKINGETIMNGIEGGRYVSLNYHWKKGDRIELFLPMPVRYMIADPRVKDDMGKIAVMRGPVVYCLEDEDIPAGEDIESLCITGITEFEPVMSGKLGGIVELKGSLIKPSDECNAFDTSAEFKSGTDIYHEIPLAEKLKAPENSATVDVSLVPFYARLNRESKYFRVWIPVTGDY